MPWALVAAQRNINKHHPVYGLSSEQGMKECANNSIHLHNLSAAARRLKRKRRQSWSCRWSRVELRGWTEICVLRARSIKKHTPQDNHFIILMISSFPLHSAVSLSIIHKTWNEHKNLSILLFPVIPPFIIMMLLDIVAFKWEEN